MTDELRTAIIAALTGGGLVSLLDWFTRRRKQITDERERADAGSWGRMQSILDRQDRRLGEQDARIMAQQEEILQLKRALSQMEREREAERAEWGAARAAFIERIKEQDKLIAELQRRLDAMESDGK